MATYIVRRILQMIPVLLGTTFIIYAMVYSLGDPTVGRCGERPCPPAYVAAFREEYNLDDPLLVQYFLYMGKILTGDLGTSYNGVSIAGELLTRWPITLKLAVIALIVEAVIGMVAGVLAGLGKGGFLDNLVFVSTLAIISIPVFVLGSVAQLIFGVRLAWFPPTATAGTWEQLILPGIVLGTLSMAYVARLTRNSLVENLGADYVRTAKAKGLTWRRTVGLHTLRNSMIPVVTYLGADVGALMGGAIVTERIFNVQGIGGYIYQSINSKDGAAIVATVTLLVLIYLLMSLLVDLLYGLLDPRISHD